jgi:Glycosyltransferase Family 4
MIVIVAAFPTMENEQDGMIQRVAHIDNLITSIPRTYLEISFRRFFHKEVFSKGGAKVYRLNAFAHFFLISIILKKSDIIYIHSAYNALKVIGIKTKAHVVFDAHGIVPEELEQEGHPWAARIISIAEKSILSRCNTLVCVTRSMLKHFKAKHGQRFDREEIILPILPQIGDGDTQTIALQAIRDDRSVIYAGGMQAWQNVDKMLTAAKAQPMLRYTFLTGNLENFKRRLQESGIREYDCRSVSPEEVKNYYLTHEYGFILRDEVLVNLVACPTKLVEYLYWGVIPIVITPHIGDFDDATLRGITIDQFMQGDLPDAATRAAMRLHNQTTVLSLFSSAEINQELLKDRLTKAA